MNHHRIWLRLIITYVPFLGNCISTIAPDNLCELNSTALDCNDDHEAISCLCNPGFRSEYSPCDLQGKLMLL